MTAAVDTARRLQRLREALPGRAVVAADPANVNWLTALRAQGHRLYGNTPLWVVVGPSGDGFEVIAHGCDVGWVAGEVDLARVHQYGEFRYAGEAGERLRPRSRHATIEEAAAAALTAAGADGEVAVDDGLSWTGCRRLAAEIAPREIVPGAEQLLAARRVKDAAELAAMREANLIAEAAIAAAVDRMRVGVTEAELLAAIRREMGDRGALPQLGAVGIGERGALVDAEPGERALRRGETVRFDVGCTVAGYHADLSRTAALGQPEDWVAEAYAALLAGERAAIEATGPGAAPGELFARAVDATRAVGIADYERSHCGHGIGATIYEPPLVAAASDGPRLEPGMTLCLETPWYATDRVGLQVEDAVVVTADGCERLGEAGQDLIVVS